MVKRAYEEYIYERNRKNALADLADERAYGQAQRQGRNSKQMYGVPDLSEDYRKDVQLEYDKARMIYWRAQGLSNKEIAKRLRLEYAPGYRR